MKTSAPVLNAAALTVQRFFAAALRLRAAPDLRDAFHAPAAFRAPAAFFPPDALRPPRAAWVSPLRARCLLTVRAAISSARSSPTPRSSSESFTCSYCRLRFALVTPRGGMCADLPGLRVRPAAQRSKRTASLRHFRDLGSR